MRSYSALALLTALIAACLGAQSDRSRQRSSPIKSVPVAANVKRDADFDCPEEFGYYPHPTDCTLYYVCVFGGALLESCTGGLMYSHELQTCDWPRNVGCDGGSIIGGEEPERFRERDPPPPPPRKSTSSRRTPPPPPPRVQPNPVITSRGQPKFNRNEYEKQQQLYAEVDDLPPIEEIESDRQQRVYRGQPSTIGQVQKDRDGYVSQSVNSGRNLNSNIIPASLSQNSKIGSFSFGSQVDDRRTAAVTPVPQSYSDDRTYVTDLYHDRQKDVEMNVIDITDNDVTDKPLLRKKREVVNVGTNETVKANNSQRSDVDDVIEYVDTDSDSFEKKEEIIHGETERGKRQIRYILRNKYRGSGYPILKSISANNFQQTAHTPNGQIIRYQPVSLDAYNTNYYQTERSPTFFDNNVYTLPNTFLNYQQERQQQQGHHYRPSQSNSAFPSFGHSVKNTGSSSITKSPPISSLNNNGNLFYSLAGGFYNNSPRPSSINNNNNNLPPTTKTSGNHPNNKVRFPDSSLLPSTVVTGKPLIMSSLPNNNSYRSNSNHIGNQSPTQGKLIQTPEKKYKDEYYSNEGSLEYDESSEEEEDEDFKPLNIFPKPPYAFTHPNNKFANIENPFANPNFDFDVFLSKLSNGEYTLKSKFPMHDSSQSSVGVSLEGTTINYKGMSTPKPFTDSTGFVSTIKPHAIIKQSQLYSPLQQSQPSQSSYYQNQTPHENIHTKLPQQTNGISIDSLKLKLKPPNFNDDRELPLTYSFTTIKPKYNETKFKGRSQFMHTGTQKPHIIVTGAGASAILSTPKYQYIVKPESIRAPQPHFPTTSKPYIEASIKPFIQNVFPQSTQRPSTTLTNERLLGLQQYWRNPSVDYSKLGSLFAQAGRSSTQVPTKNHNVFNNELKNLLATTTMLPPKRRPIPKPSPEMTDYYYDDEDDQYYYEPIVKPKYMPSTEVRPQRPHMAQNYKEYDDSYDESPNKNLKNIKSLQSFDGAVTINTHRPVTKNYNDVPTVTKIPMKHSNSNTGNKFPVPVLVEYAGARPSVIIRPEVSNYEIIHQNLHNHTMLYKKPTNSDSGPNTIKPPKYLNQTTLRPYTVRHRLAKPPTFSNKDLSKRPDNKETKAVTRHQNIVAQMKLTTPKDNYNQETRYSKTNHDDKTNSLEPTESVVPISYSPSPRPKMLYNGSQNYNPDQYDPFYAVYDEDGELYKDTDYVQQYNVASLRPAVQQTYRGTPPPSRRPVENYTPRPVTHDDYDDELIQGQINNKNQYQSPVRHSTRGEGNELGYDHNPSSVRTTLYEATSISTIPPTSSTSTTTTTTTTTQRSTTAQFTEAMIPSRYTPRLPSDEKPSKPETSSNPPNVNPISLDPSVSPYTVNFSSLAKPFELTDNLNRLQSTLLTTEKILTSRHSSVVTNKNNKLLVEKEQPISRGKKKGVSLTTGFSFRRNLNNTNNPYTLTLHTRPVNEYNRLINSNDQDVSTTKYNSGRYNHENENNDIQSVSANIAHSSSRNGVKSTSENTFRRKDALVEKSDTNDFPVYTRPPNRNRESSKSAVKITSDFPTTTIIASTTPIPRVTERLVVTNTQVPTTKYYLKTVLKRPTSAISNVKPFNYTDNTFSTESLIDLDQKNKPDNLITSNYTDSKESLEWNQYDRYRDTSSIPIDSPYTTLDNLSTNYKSDLTKKQKSSILSTTPFAITVTGNKQSNVNTRIEDTPQTDSSYYSYHVQDDDIRDQTTEIFSGKVKHVIQAFFNNFISTPAQLITQDFTSTTPLAALKNRHHKLVDGIRKKIIPTDEKLFKNRVKHLKILQESSTTSSNTPDTDIKDLPIDIDDNINLSPTTLTMPITTSTSTYIPPVTFKKISTRVDSYKYKFENESNDYLSKSKFKDLIEIKPKKESITTPKSKFQNMFNENASEITITTENVDNNEFTSTKAINNAPLLNKLEDSSIDEAFDIASTTSTTKSTTTEKLETTTKTTTTTSKSISFPTRPSRVNPAIKLAATNPGDGRRSYQSSSKCSTDNSLQANPKCNEIKYQRPTSTRGRGSAHYSTSGGSDAAQPAPNRGTPPTRSRPTLKPSTAIVSKTTEFVDIYAHPPSRPAPVYPQPTLDKTAAKCRKDVCLLPDCYCGGKDIPGDLPVESVPQIVLLTFDDSVNDLNKGLYADLFEKGRVNPNGCPISATFYVSHEWTDYSQVQNLYSSGHEMASHTVSHSFGEQFSQKKWNREVAGQREILAAYGGVKLEDVRGMRAPFLSVGGNKMFKMLYDSNFTYDSSLPVYENRPPSWPYTLDYKLFHDCMIPPCPTKSYPGVWEVPMVMWQDLNGGRCSMGDACANPPEAENVYKMILKNFDRHYTTNRAPFGLFYHAAWFTQPHHKEGFIMFLDFINQMPDVWIVTNWQALQWVRDPTPISRLNSFQPFQCNYQDRPKKCNNPKVCNLWHKSGVRYMRTCQPCPEIYPWTGKTGIRSSRIDNDIGE